MNVIPLSEDFPIFEGIVITDIGDACFVMRSKKHPEKGWNFEQSSPDSKLGNSFIEFLSGYLAEVSKRKGRQLSFDRIDDLLMEQLAKTFVSKNGNVGTALAESLHSLFS